MTDENENLPIAHDEPVAEHHSMTAVERLRFFEDENLGEDAVRINGRVEKGSGSWFQTKLTDAQRAHHAALEHLIDTEQAVADAKAKLAQAEDDHAKAEVAANQHG
jgi:hypothetical protein